MKLTFGTAVLALLGLSLVGGDGSSPSPFVFGARDCRDGSRSTVVAQQLIHGPNHRHLLSMVLWVRSI